MIRSVHCNLYRKHDNVAQHSHFVCPLTQIWVSKFIIIGLDKGLSSDRRQAIIRTNGGILLTGLLGTNLREILIEIHFFNSIKYIWNVVHQVSAILS